VLQVSKGLHTWLLSQNWLAGQAPHAFIWPVQVFVSCVLQCTTPLKVQAPVSVQHFPIWLPTATGEGAAPTMQYRPPVQAQVNSVPLPSSKALPFEQICPSAPVAPRLEQVSRVTHLLVLPSQYCAAVQLHGMSAPVQVFLTEVLQLPGVHTAMLTQQLPAVPAGGTAPFFTQAAPPAHAQSSVPPHPSSSLVPHDPA